MNSVKQLGFILAATLMVSSFAGAPAIAQQDGGATLTKRVGELYEAGKFSEAIPLAQRALAIRERAFGPNHAVVAASLDNLALLYDQLGRYVDAEPLYKRALAIKEKALGPDHPEVARSLDGLAALHKDQGRHADAEPLFRRALAIREKAFGPGHREVAASLSNRALVYDLQGRYAEAEPLYKRAMAIEEKALGPDHLELARTLNNMAGLYSRQGRYADAEPLYKRALAIYEKALGPDHPELAASLNNLAQLYYRQGRYADAEPLFRRALAIREKALGYDHPDVATALDNLATLYERQGRYADAEPLSKRALRSARKRSVPTVPLSHYRSITWRQSTTTKVATPMRSRSSTDRSRSARKRSVPTIPMSRYRSTTWLRLTERKVAMPMRCRWCRPRSGMAARTHPVALPVLFAAQGDGMVPIGKALDDALNVVQRASQSAAAAAVNKLAARLAAGTDRLASLVRNDQDLAAEAEALDKAILAAVSKEAAKRDAAAEQRIRDRLADITKQRTTLQAVFAAEFPDYAALSNPQPLTVKEIQGLLSDGEALLLYTSCPTARRSCCTRPAITKAPTSSQ
jgi:tetratricopeptide (TPR) repeat protein